MMKPSVSKGVFLLFSPQLSFSAVAMHFSFFLSLRCNTVQECFFKKVLFKDVNVEYN